MGVEGSRPEDPLALGEPRIEVQRFPVTFRWPDPANSVFLSGSFNSWQERVPMQRGLDGTWFVVQKLAPGRYEYKFIVDNCWKYAPDQPLAKDMSGNTNNVVAVDPRGSTQETPYAARQDAGGAGAAPGAGADVHDHPAGQDPTRMPSRSVSESRLGAIDKFFTSEIPDRPAEYWNTYPIETPRQLSRTPLNDSVTADGFLPSFLLAIPEHIVLTHYFHQRKKRGVAVSASTGRHRSKYVTAVLYSATEPVLEYPGIAEAILNYIP